MPSEVEEAVKDTIRQARTLITQGKGTELLRLMKEADADLGKRLVKAATERGGKFGDRFTDAKMIAFKNQISTVTSYVEKRLTGMTHEKVMSSIRIGTAHTVKLIKAFEKDYAGIAESVRIDHTRIFNNVGQKLTPSLLSRSRASVERYGRVMVRDFDLVMQRGIAQGLTQSEMIDKLISKAPPKLAAYLHHNEPRSFPDPKTGYMRKRYWAERIVRTETANAYNAANLASIEESRNEFPDMGKKILAIFDKRTAIDSMYVHGQIRGVDELFHDGAGREYLRPPARPNDRETIVPWRMPWKETAATKPKSLTEIKKSEAAQATSQRIPPRPPGMMNSMVQKRIERTRQAKFTRPTSVP